MPEQNYPENYVPLNVLTKWFGEDVTLTEFKQFWSVLTDGEKDEARNAYHESLKTEG